MTEPLTADALRARLSGALPSDGKLLQHPTDTTIKMTKPCRSGDTDCTADCGWCKGTGVQGGKPGNPLDMPGGGPPDFDTSPPESKRDLVSDTLARYRTEQAKDVAAAAAGRPNFRKVADVEPVEPVAKNRRANKYAADCITCGARVPAETGYLAKTADGKWAAEHQQCPAAEPEIAATSTADPTSVTIRAVTGQVYTGVHPGIYTLETANGHRTFRVRVQGTEDDFNPGSTILDCLTGPDNSPSSKDWMGFAFLRGTRMAVWSKHRENTALIEDATAFLADPAAALESVNCIRCNATLTVPESVLVGMGPTCRNKGW